MLQPRQSPARSVLGSLVLIAVIIGVGAVAFAYTAGWLSPHRIAPDQVVDALAPPTGVGLGHRRNHAKGICFTGMFEANGAGSALSGAQVFTPGQYPVVGRFNLGTPNPDAPDATVRVRGLGLQISTPDGQVWRSAMIDLPFFPVATPQAFLRAAARLGEQGPGRDEDLAGAHPEIAAFGAWAKTAPGPAAMRKNRTTASTASSSPMAPGRKKTVRWSLLPAAQRVLISQDDLAKRGPDFLEQEITQRVAAGPLHWTLAVTVANPGDPTADPSKAWPPDRRTVEVGTLTVQRIEAERDGPCRDINFDPTILPSGIGTSDDPFPAARSAAYAVSFNRRTAEASDYPRTATDAKP